MISGATEPQGFLAWITRGNEGNNRTEWDFELRREMNRFADLNYAIRGCIVQEPLKVEDKDRWKRLEKYLLARFARVGLADLYGLGVRDVCECVFNGLYRIGLHKRVGG